MPRTVQVRRIEIGGADVESCAGFPPQTNAADTPIKIRRKQPSGKRIRRSVALIAPRNDGGNARIVPFFAVVYVFNRKAYFRHFRRKIYLRKIHEIFKPIFKFERIAFIERSDDGGFDAVVRFVKVAILRYRPDCFPFPVPTDCGEGN